MKNQVLIYGRHAVLSALANPDRQIAKILCTRENLDEVAKIVDKNKVSIVDRRDIDKLLPRDAVHQGFVVYAAALPDYSIEQICDMSQDFEKCTVLVLDQVSDPQNIGAIIRSCVAFGALALVIQDKNSPEETGAMVKASAGTIEHLPIARVTNLSRALESLKRAGFWTVGMDGSAQSEVSQMSKNGKTAIVMGSEGKGMRRLVEENCDLVVKLPISSKVESLNVSTAAAIVLYELNK